MADKDNPQGVRVDAAKAAAPYVHARLAHQTYSGPGGGNIVVELVRFFDDTGRTIEGEASESVEAPPVPTKALALP